MDIFNKIKKSWPSFLPKIDNLINSWHIFITVIIIVGSVTYLVSFNFSLSASDLGSFLSGVSSSLAFIWLINGMRIQSENLRLQRIALETQARELFNNAKFSSFSQIENLITRANQVIVESELKISKPNEIGVILMRGMVGWKNILESSSPDVVKREYEEWIKIEGIARQYLAYVCQALKIYLDYNTGVKYDPTAKDEDFFCVYSSWGNKVPFLTEHIGSAHYIAQHLSIVSPGLESMKVAGFYALGYSAGFECFKEGVLEEMKSELISKGYCIPAIVSKHIAK